MHADFNLLTSRQKKVYSVIESYIRYNGIPPTVREIGEMVGEKTPGAVQGILNRMEQKGVLTRQSGLARSIRLLASESIYENPIYIPVLKKIDKRNIKNLFNIYNISKFIPLSPEIAQNREGLFITACPANNLSGMGITTKDKLIIDTKSQYKNGDIVLVFCNDHTSLNIYLRENDDDTIILKTSCKSDDTALFKKDELQIIGKVICKFTYF